MRYRSTSAQEVVRPSGSLRTNVRDLVAVTIQGVAAHPIGRVSPYRVGNDGVPRVLPSSGGIVLNFRVGDRCIGLAGDHIEPGVSLHNNSREVVGPRNGPNLALMTYACVGNRACVLNGPCVGARGVVTGKHGGIDHVIVDFPPLVLRRLRIGDRIQITAYGLGLKLLDFPQVTILNCSPQLLQSWGIRQNGERLSVPVTHVVPAAIMGSGLGKNNAVQGDYDIQLFDPQVRTRFKLNTLRFGDFVGIVHADNRFGRSYREGLVSVGVVVHGDSTVSGHGPGLTTLLSGPVAAIQLMHDRQANLAAVLGLRTLPTPRPYPTLIQAEARQRGRRHVPLPHEFAGGRWMAGRDFSMESGGREARPAR